MKKKPCKPGVVFTKKAVFYTNTELKHLQKDKVAT